MLKFLQRSRNRMALPLDKYLPPGCKFVPPDCPSECPIKRQRQRRRRRGSSPLQHSRPWSGASSPPSPAESPLCSPPRSPRRISPPRSKGCTPTKSRPCSPSKILSRPSSASKSRSTSPATSYSCCRKGPKGPCSPPRISRECSPMARYSCPKTPKPRSLAQSRPSLAGRVPRTPCSSPLHRLRTPSVSPLSQRSSPRPNPRVHHEKPWNKGESGEGHPGATFEEIAYKNCPPPSKQPLSSFELKALRSFMDPKERHHLHPHGAPADKLRPAVYAPARGDHSTLLYCEKHHLCSPVLKQTSHSKSML